MSLNEKIEEIRKKPEHIRMRYVLAGVLFFMLVIIILWFFSVQEKFNKFKPEVQEVIPKFNVNQNEETQPSIEEFLDEDLQE